MNVVNLIYGLLGLSLLGGTVFGIGKAIKRIFFPNYPTGGIEYISAMIFLIAAPLVSFLLYFVVDDVGSTIRSFLCNCHVSM